MLQFGGKSNKKKLCLQTAVEKIFISGNKNLAIFFYIHNFAAQLRNTSQL